MSSRVVARQCTLCEAHCGIRVGVEDDRVAWIRGDPDDVMSKGYICPKATALADLHHDPERLRSPMKRVADGFEEISWTEAFRIVGQNLRRIQAEHGRSAVAMYLGNPAAHSSSVIYAVLLRTVLMTRNFFSASSVDQFPQEFVAWRMFGSSVLLPVADIDRTQHLVIIGANPAVSNGSLSTMPDAKGRIKAVRERGGKVVVIDPRRTETARLADEHISIAPGGDPYLLLGMLHTLFRDGLTRPPNLAGWDALAALVADFTPEKAAPLAGVDAETIRRLAREHAAAETALAYARIGVCHQTSGSVTHWLVNVLNAVTGNLDRPGGQMFAKPAVDLMPLLRHLAPAYGRWTDRGGTRKSFRYELPAAGLSDDILAPGDGQIRALITYAGNPVLSTPQAGRLDAALDSLDFMVSVDMYVTETTRHADVILPPISQLEREEFDVVLPAFSVHNNARFNARVFEPPAGSLEDWEILSRLALEVTPVPARRLTWALLKQFSPMRLSAAGVLAGPHGRLRHPFRGLSIDRIRKTAGGIDLGALTPRLRDLITTKDGRVQLAPEDLVAEARKLIAQGAKPVDREFDLRLIGRRHVRSNNSWLHNVPSMVKGRDRCTALINPQDAGNRGLTSGVKVVVRSPMGRLELPVEISDEIRPGTIAIPHGWGHDEKGVGWSTAAAHGGVNVNLLHDPALADTLSGNAALNGTWVNVERCPEPSAH